MLTLTEEGRRKIDAMPRAKLTEAQVAEHDLPTAPPKRSDSRSANWIGETCQAEAMPPDLLATTVREAIESHLDLDVYHEQLEQEKRDTAEIRRVLDTVEMAEEDEE